VIVEPLLLVWQALREQIANFDRQVNLRAKTETIARRLMTIPSVGVIVYPDSTGTRNSLLRISSGAILVIA
jgi:hypothetical protein